MWDTMTETLPRWLVSSYWWRGEGVKAWYCMCKIREFGGMGKEKMAAFKRGFYIAPLELHIWVGWRFVTWHPGGVPCGNCRDDNSGLKLRLSLGNKRKFITMPLKRYLCSFRDIYAFLRHSSSGLGWW